jgi:hypothetical protein
MIGLTISFTYNKPGILQLLKMMGDCRTRDIHAAACLGKCLFQVASHVATCIIMKGWLIIEFTLTIVDHQENLETLFIGKGFKNL